MNQRAFRVIGSLLIPMLMLDPASASMDALRQGAGMVSLMPSIGSHVFSDQALNTASDFILQPPLLKRQFSARVYRRGISLRAAVVSGSLGWNLLAWGAGHVSTLAHLFERSTVGEPVVGQWAGIEFVHIVTGSVLLGGAAVAIAWFGRDRDRGPQYRFEQRQRMHAALWKEFGRLLVSDSRKSVEIDVNSDFMAKPEKWHGPHRFPAIQNISYQLIGSLLAELEENQHLSGRQAGHIVRAFLVAASSAEPLRLAYRAMEHYQTGETHINIWTYTIPNPYVLKPFLIGIQTGKYRFGNLDEPAVERLVSLAIHEGRSEPPDAFRDVFTVGRGLPKLPHDLEERKALLRSYLLWLAEEPSSQFDASRVEHLLENSAFVESLSDHDPRNRPVMLVDPLSFDVITQQVSRVGVLWRRVAAKIGAVQYSSMAAVQLDENVDRDRRHILMFVRPQDRNHGGTLSFSGVVDYEYGKSMELTLRTLLAQYLGFEAGHDLLSQIPPGADVKEYWEKVPMLAAPVYNGESGEDIQYREVFIYHPPKSVQVLIDQHIARWNALKAQYPGPEEFEAAELAGHKRARAMVKITVEKLVDYISYFRRSVRQKKPMKPGEYCELHETFKGGREVVTPINLNPDVMVFLDDNSEGRGRFLSGRTYTDLAYKSHVEAVQMGRKSDNAQFAITLDHNEDPSMYDAHPVFQIWRSYFRHFIELSRPLQDAISNLGFSHVHTLYRDASGKFAIPHGDVHPFLSAIREMQALLGPQAAALDRIEKVHLVSGRFDPEALPEGLRGQATVEEMAGVFIVRESLGNGRYALWVHEDSLGPAKVYLDGPRATPLSKALFMYGLFLHEHVQEHVDRRIVASGQPVRHEDLESYGATFERIIESIETGIETPFLKQIAQDAPLDWNRLRNGSQPTHHQIIHSSFLMAA